MPRVALTQQVHDRIVRMACDGATDVAICDAIGISTRTLYRWFKRAEPQYVALVADYARARAGDETRLFLKVVAAAEDPKEWRAAAWLLARRYHWVETPPDSSGDDPAWDIWDADTEPSDG